MLAFTKYNEEEYERAAQKIIYGKLYPLIERDFLLRVDAAEMMDSKNLIIRAIPLTGTAGPATISGTASGLVSPLYNGRDKSPNAGQIEKMAQLDKENAATKAEAPVKVIKSIMDQNG